jgi:hypothetical protein
MYRPVRLNTCSSFYNDNERLQYYEDFTVAYFDGYNCDLGSTPLTINTGYATCDPLIPGLELDTNIGIRTLESAIEFLPCETSDSFESIVTFPESERVLAGFLGVGDNIVTNFNSSHWRLTGLRGGIVIKAQFLPKEGCFMIDEYPLMVTTKSYGLANSGSRQHLLSFLFALFLFLCFC